MPPRRQPGRQPNQNMIGGMASSGLGLLGAAPSQLQQGFGGSSGMGQNTQMGMGARSLMGGGTQFKGNTVHLGGGESTQDGRGKSKALNPTKHGFGHDRGHRGGRNVGRQSANTQSQPLLPDPVSQQADQGYGAKQQYPGTHRRHTSRPQSDKGRRALRETEYYSEEQYNEEWSQGQIKRRGLLGEAPHEVTAGYQAEKNYGNQGEQYDAAWQQGSGGGLLGEAPQNSEATAGYQAEENVGYQEEQYNEAWPVADKKQPLLGEAPQYDGSQAYQGEYTDSWPPAEQRETLVGEGQQYPEDPYTRPVSLNQRRKPLIGEAPQYSEAEGYVEEYAETWSKTEIRKPLLGEAPQYSEETQSFEERTYGGQIKRRKQPVRKAPHSYKEEPQEYPEGYQEVQEGYTDTWPPLDKGRKPISRGAHHSKTEAQAYQGYAETGVPAENKRKPLLGQTPQYGEEGSHHEQYTDTWPAADMPPNTEWNAGYSEGHHTETWPAKKRGLLGAAPANAKDAQGYTDGQYTAPQPPAAKRRPLLGEVPAHVGETQEYGHEQEYHEQRTDNRRGLLGDAPATGYEGEQYTEEWAESATGKGLLGDAPANTEAAYGYEDAQSATKTKTGLLGDAPPYAAEGQGYVESENPESWSETGGKKGLLGDAPGYEERTEAGENYPRRTGQRRPKSYAEDRRAENHKKSGGMQQRSEMQQRSQMGMRNQFGMQGDREMGMDNRTRSSSQTGSDQFRMKEMDNRRNSAGSGKGLLGSGPDQGRGYGDKGRTYGDQYSDRQSGNYMERSTGQQPRSLLEPHLQMEDARMAERERALAERERLLAEQERALALEREERQLILQRAEQLRIQQEEQLRIRREEQLREEQLRAERIRDEQLRAEQMRDEQLRAEQMRAMQILQQEQQQRNRLMQPQQRPVGKADGLLGEAPGSVAGQRVIPSIFDLPTGNRLQGKRPGDKVTRPGDKRPRRESSSDRRRGPSRPDNRRDQQNKKQQDRGKPRTDHSPASQKKDQTQSGSRQSAGSRHDVKRESKSKDSKKETETKDKKDVKTDKGKAEKGKDTKAAKPDPKAGRTVNTKITVTIEGDSGGDKYDPAHPTVDEQEEMGPDGELKMNEEELEKMIEKEDDDVMVLGEGDKDGKLNESNLTVTVTKNKRSVNDADGKSTEEKNEEKKPAYHCNVCNVKCFTEKNFSDHLTGVKHQRMMETVMAATEKRSQEIAARLKAESHIKKIEGQGKRNGSDSKGSPEKASPRKPMESHCRTCDKKFTGAYKDHKETAEHMERETRRRAGCKICSIPSFSNYNIYTAHLESDLHKKNKQRLRGSKDEDTVNVDEMSDLVTLDVIGFEDESSQQSGGENMDISQDEKVSEESKSMTFDLEPLTPMLSKAKATSTPKLPEKFELPKEIKVPGNHDPNSPVGQDFIVAVSGYFCKLCHKFYNNRLAARTTHCQTKAHFDKYKNAMIAKLARQQRGAEGFKTREVMDTKSQIIENISESQNADHSGNATKTPDQSAVTESASNYETADEHQESTVQKTTESSQETLENTDKELVNGNAVDNVQEKEDHKSDGSVSDQNADSQSQESESGTVDLTGNDDDNSEIVAVKGKGRGIPSTSRGGASRNKARRAKRI